MTVRAAEIFALPYRTLAVGASADMILIDNQNKQTIDADGFVSKGRTTPFNGWVAKGWPILTIFEGNIVYQEAE
nr:hypothetical protein [Bacillus velezensis]